MDKSVWDKMKDELNRRFPPVTALPLLDRVRASIWGRESQYGITWTDPDGLKGEFTQNAILVEFKGKEYLKKFGTLR